MSEMRGGLSMLEGKRCLVVDDELLIALDIQHELEAHGAAQVVCAGGLADAYAAVDTTRFDLAILDVRLGRAGESGMAIAEVLAKAGTPFIFLTGGRADAADIAAFAVPVVEKPFLPALLLDAVRKALGAG